MHYYKHHIGDFNNATRHMTRMERAIYRDMLELYYETEEQLPLDVDFICRKVAARSNEERTAVEQALNEFFIETPTGYFQSRCEEEIHEYKTSNSQKSAAGRASAAKRALRKQQAMNGCSTGVGTGDERSSNGIPTNHKPLTINQDPRSNNEEPKKEKKPTKPKTGSLALDYSSWPSMPSDEVLSDWQSHRKNKKASNSQTAINGIGKQLHEAVKNGFTVDQCLEECVCRGWAGFKAEWMNGSQKKPTNAISHNLNGITYQEQDL